jgi:phosphate-selective porin OprO and OprP
MAMLLWSVVLSIVAASPLPVTVQWNPGEGVNVMTVDGRFSLTVRGRAQLRFDVEGPKEEGEDITASFQVRRLRLSMQGHVFGKDWRYQVQLAFANRDTEPDLRLPLRDAFFTYAGWRDAHIRFGQMKVPSGRQRLTSSGNLQMVDRSIANAEFNLDRDVGVQLLSTDLFGLGDVLQYNVGIFGGEGRNRLGGDLRFLYVGRIAINPFGKFDDLVEADFERSPKPRLSVSFSGAYNHGTRRSRSTFDETYLLGTFDYVHGGFDALLKWHGLSMLLEIYYRDVVGIRSHSEGEVSEVSRAGVGGIVQLGYFVADGIELSGRFARVLPVSDDTAVKPGGEALLGVSWYLLKHSLKLQLDGGWLFAAVPLDGHPQVRVQTQIAF